MNRTRRAALSVCVAIALLAVGCDTTGGDSESTTARSDAAQYAFQDALNDPLADWDGPVFQLSHDYPAVDPGVCPPTVCTWLEYDVGSGFDADLSALPPTWDSGPYQEYLSRVWSYVMEGQDPNLPNDVGFQVDVNGATRWFHVPWMAFDSTTGRDFIHGTTNERTAHLSDFIGPDDGTDSQFGKHFLTGTTEACQEEFPHGFETWAVGVYNEWGGYSLGQAIPESGVPQIGEYDGSPMGAGLPFPQGTVVAKFLTTNAPPRCVPYLQGSPEWQIHRHRMDASGYACEREVQISRIVQVDVAVTDSRAPTGWVYGTYAYNGEAPGATALDRLLPVGLQWGSDPWTFPAVPESESLTARESVLNVGIGLPEHFGCEGRLAGPVDNPMSSCISCHASAFAAPDGQPSIMGTNVPPSFGFTGLCTDYSQDNQNYFQNVIPPQRYTGGQYPDAVSLDTSLQLEVAYDQYGVFNTLGRSRQCQNPNQF